MVDCYSYRQRCELGPVPPRTPGRADAQLPRDDAVGLVRYGRIGHFYFYHVGSNDDPAFGFVDVELSAQQVAPGKVRVEAYCIGDGYQSARGSGLDHPLVIELRAGERALASVEWRYPEVLCGHADPLDFSVDINLSEADFAALDSAVMPAVSASATPCG